MLKKVKLKGNESFHFREGWLRKGMRLLQDDPCLFSSNEAMEILGLGSKMVKSLKFWLLSTGICEEFTMEGRVRGLRLTQDFGEVIYENDPYFDDFFTLTLLHYNIAQNESFNMVWHLFFNEFNATMFQKENMVEMCQVALEKRMAADAQFSSSSFSDDCTSLLAMYLEDKNHLKDPEEKLTCPLSDLKLLQKTRNGQYLRCPPPSNELNLYSLLYVMVGNLDEDRNAVSIDQLHTGKNNIGKVFHLDRVLIEEYLDRLRAGNFLTISRSGNLNTVYFTKKWTTIEVMQEYYRNQVG